MRTKSYLKKPLATGVATVLLLSTGLAAADPVGYGPPYGDGPDYRDRAKVVSAVPVYDRINTPSRECRTEYHEYQESASNNDGHNTGGAVLGAIVGGLLGSTVGKGNGKVAAAAVGAATGAVVGDRSGVGSTDTYTTTRPVEHCRMVDNYQQQVVGYDVTYRYEGRTFTTRMPFDPGNWVSVRVSVVVVPDAPPPPPRRWDEGRRRWFDD